LVRKSTGGDGGFRQGRGESAKKFSLLGRALTQLEGRGIDRGTSQRKAGRRV